MNIAFFDFDGTLTKHDSFLGFALFSRGKLAFLKAFLRSLPILISWKIGLKTNSEAKERLFSMLYRGMEYAAFKHYCENFSDYIEGDLRPEIVRLLSNHKRQNHQVIIVSASIQDWILPWAHSYGVDTVIGTEIEVDDCGKLTGRFRTPNCHGKEKVKRILGVIPDISNYEIWGYGNSEGDREMLEIVNHPNKV